MVPGLGHFKAKGKPLRNDVGENTRSFQDVTKKIIHIEVR
jgi:hypothetical protein